MTVLISLFFEFKPQLIVCLRLHSIISWMIRPPQKPLSITFDYPKWLYKTYDCLPAKSLHRRAWEQIHTMEDKLLPYYRHWVNYEKRAGSRTSIPNSNLIFAIVFQYIFHFTHRFFTNSVFKVRFILSSSFKLMYKPKY